MDFVDGAFIDQVVFLDGNSFARCSFDGCVLRYNGGVVEFRERITFCVENRLEWGPGVDATSPMVQWLLEAFGNAAARHKRDCGQAGEAVDP